MGRRPSVGAARHIGLQRRELALDRMILLAAPCSLLDHGESRVQLVLCGDGRGLDLDDPVLDAVQVLRSPDARPPCHPVLGDGQPAVRDDEVAIAPSLFHLGFEGGQVVTKCLDTGALEGKLICDMLGAALASQSATDGLPCQIILALLDGEPSFASPFVALLPAIGEVLIEATLIASGRRDLGAGLLKVGLHPPDQSLKLLLGVLGPADDVGDVGPNHVA